tara:strand:- start:126 stop:1883 length:1758 start_codon:yes stop_codon:yes gene_type:complete
MALISTSATSASPVTILKNTNADANGPILKLHNDSGDAANNDSGGLVQFVVEDANGDDVIAAQLNGVLSDVTNGGEDGGLVISGMVNGSLTSLVDIGKSSMGVIGLQSTVAIGGGSSASPLLFMENSGNGTNYISLQAPASVGSNVAFTLPNADGSNGQVLSTNGSGVLSWTAAGSLSGLGSTDNVLLRTNGTGGGTAQGSSIVVDDSDNMSAVGTLATTGAITIAAAGGLAGLGAGGNEFSITESSDDITIQTLIADKDMIFKVNDGSSATEVFRLDGDVSALLIASGKELQFGDSGEKISGDGTDLTVASGGKIVLDSTTAIEIDSAAGDVTFMDGGTAQLALDMDGTAGEVIFQLKVDSDDLVFKQYDGTEVLRLDDDGSAYVKDNLSLKSDAAELKFGADEEIKLIHVADTGLTLKHTATADDKPVTLALATGETDIAADDVIGCLAFAAPDEGAGTDAILTAAAIKAVSEGDFAADNNATYLGFYTGASEAATLQCKVTSAGHFVPASAGSGDLGSSALPWANVYTQDLHLNNGRGDWVLIEEPNYLTIRNNATGRRFKLLMEDITDVPDAYGPALDGTM